MGDRLPQQTLGRASWSRWLVVACLAITSGSATAAETVEQMNARLVALYQQGKYAEASDLQQQLIGMYERSRPVDEGRLARALNNLAELFRQQARFAEAIPPARRALEIRERIYGRTHHETAGSLINLGAIERSLGHFPEAEQYYKQAAAVLEAAPGGDPLALPTVLNNLAEVHLAQGHARAAEPVFRQALATLEKSRGPGDRFVAGAVGNLAQVLVTCRKFDEALPLFRRAVAAQEKSLGPEHPDLAGTLDNLALLLDLLGKPSEAEPLARRALAIREKALGDHPSTAASLLNLGELLAETGRKEEALELVRRGLAIDEAKRGPDHPDTLAALGTIARLEAEGEDPTAAAATFDRLRRGIRSHAARVLPGMNDAEQVWFFQFRDEPQLHAAVAFAVAHAGRPDVADLSAGWLVNGKGAAQEATAQRSILARAAGDPTLARDVAGLAKLRGDIAAFIAFVPPPEMADRYRGGVEKALGMERDLVQRIGGRVAEAAATGARWVAIDDVRAVLPADGVFIDLIRYQEPPARGSDSPPAARYAAWIVPPAGQGSVKIIDLGAAEPIDEAAHEWRRRIDRPRKEGFSAGQVRLEEDAREAGRRLAELVLDPLVAAADPEGERELIVSPDGPLWLVPWVALPLADGRYAIERNAFTLVTSGRDLVARDDAGAGPPPGPPLVVASPDFDVSPERLSRPAATPAEAAAGMSAARPAAVLPGGRALAFPAEPLPGTLVEARAAVPPLEAFTSRKPTLLTAAAAEEAAVKRAARPQVLVLATHGFFRDGGAEADEAASRALAARGVGGAAGLPPGFESPLYRCGLLLAGANTANTPRPAGVDDGILEGIEIVGLDLADTDLVVLSACDTGVGEVRSAAGVASLRQAFQIAGAKRVVATLWKVPDGESAAIMAAFYANLAGGSPPSKALREAQLAFIKQRRDDRNYEAAHPYLWAAYGVTGRWRERVSPQPRR